MTSEELLSPAQRSRRGVWSDWRSAPPVSASDIRRWAIAVYWPEPPPSRFVQEDTREDPTEQDPGRTLIAPQEFNPFAWLPSGPPRTSMKSGVKRVLAGCSIRYGVPIGVGDVIRSRSRLDGWNTRGGAGGEMLLVDYSHEWRNQEQEVVRDAIYTLLLKGHVDAPG